jgi:flavin reductase (DIM6/NTAB) family NADH-FMN oxidoreductase RutF
MTLTIRRHDLMKVDVEYLEYMWPMRHFLITCGNTQEKANIIAVSFCMPVSKIPPMLACAIGNKAYSCELIENTGELVVNVPTAELKKEIYYCGYNSGRNVDKFKETGLTPLQGRTVKVPIIEECVAHMECAVRQMADTGDKKLFIGEVIEAYADKAVVKGEKRVTYSQGDFPQRVYSTRLRPPAPPSTT